MLYDSINENSSPFDISGAYSQWASANGGNTQQNQQTALNFLKQKGISQDKINNAWSMYQNNQSPQSTSAPQAPQQNPYMPAQAAPAPAPSPIPSYGQTPPKQMLYQSLNSQSSPFDISSAYGQWASANGGNSNQNQQEALNFLRQKGIGQDKINSAWDMYNHNAYLPKPTSSGPALQGSSPYRNWESLGDVNFNAPTVSGTATDNKFIYPYAQRQLDRAENLATQGYTPFGQSTNAGANSYQDTGYSALYDRGRQGAGEVSAGRNYLTSLITGGQENKFAGSNPYLQETIDNTVGDMRRNFDATSRSATSRAARGDTFGGARANLFENEQLRDFNDSVGKTVANMRFGDYAKQADLAESGINRRLQGSLAAPAFSQVDYGDIGNMINAGNMVQGQRQNAIDADYRQYLDAREWPYKQGAFMNQSLGLNGGGQAAPQPVANKGANALGGAMLGYNALKDSGNGLLGAVGGGLLSFL